MKLKNMKLATCLSLGVLLLCAAFTQTSRADEKRDAKIKAKMIQNYLLWQVAYKNSDAERIISFESPDYTLLAEKKVVVSKKDSDAAWRAAMKKVRKVTDARVEIKQLTIESNRVVVLTNQFFEADTRTPENKLEHITVTWQVRDIWVEYSHVWMLKRSERNSTKRTIDGKAVPPRRI